MVRLARISAYFNQLHKTQQTIKMLLSSHASPRFGIWRCQALTRHSPQINENILFIRVLQRHGYFPLKIRRMQIHNA